jgi:hypothetical protein
MDATICRHKSGLPARANCLSACQDLLDWSSSHRRGFPQHRKRLHTKFGQQRQGFHRSHDGTVEICAGGLLIVEQVDAAATGFRLIEETNFSTEPRHLSDLGSNRVESALNFRTRNRKLVVDLQEVWHPRTLRATSDHRKRRLCFCMGVQSPRDRLPVPQKFCR